MVVAVPRLRDDQPFRLLDPERLDEAERSEAATIKGAERLARPLAVAEVPPIDLVLCGSVAVDRHGTRIGKGGGFSDLELALLAERGAIGPETVIATTVHPLQLLDERLPRAEHDLPLDVIVTPERTIDVEEAGPRPPGILPRALDEQQLASIPALAAWREPAG